MSDEESQHVAEVEGAEEFRTVLVVDDSTAIRQILSRQLREGGYRVRQAADGAEALEMCHTERPDLVLLDVDMPVLDGLATLRQMKADPELARTPVLFLTARTTATDVAEGLGLGAQDYLRKPCEPAELLARVSVAMAANQQERRLLTRNRQLDALSATDPLTGLGNRRRFDTRVAELRESDPEVLVGVAMLDIDHFKRINDTEGHVAGDMVLTVLAARLRGVISDEDTLVRWGGEELLLLLSADRVDSLPVMATLMNAAVAGSPMAVGVDHTVPVTVSVGWARGRIADLDSVIAAADTALYRAKSEGRNRVCAAAHDQPDP